MSLCPGLLITEVYELLTNLISVAILSEVDFIKDADNSKQMN